MPPKTPTSLWARLLGLSLAVSGPAAAQGAAGARSGAAAGSAPENAPPVQLSPFEVVAENKGYYASNTMSGTRLNSKIEDLGASITVITKEQMRDFALLDLNDIFAYEAGTEGTGNFTDIAFNQNGETTDNISLNPESANRIRGLGPANNTFGNFETSGRVPIDPLAIDAVEISRGPNSSIFGIGNTSGTVNAVPASANLRSHRSETSLRFDSKEGFRTTLDLNRVLKRDVLAIRGSAAYQRDAFEQKPSGVDSVRYNGMLKWRPFRHTTLSALGTYYRAWGVRANSVTPTDGIGGWIAAGRPVFDPVDRLLTVNGTSTFIASGTPASLAGVSPDSTQLYIDQGGQLKYAQAASWRQATDPNTRVGSAVVLRQSNYSDIYAGQPLFVTQLPLHDKAIYDYSAINLAGANYVRDQAESLTVSLEQIFFHTPVHSLAGQLGWFREANERFQNVVIGIPRAGGAMSPVLIDVNTRNLDGTPNPFFLRPYISSRPYRESTPLERDNYRAQLAYTLDLRQQERMPLRWLGQHQFTAYGDYKETVQRRIRWRDVILSEHSWIPAGVARGSLGQVVGGLPSAHATVIQSIHRNYIGDNQGDNIDYAPSYFTPGTYNFNYGNGATFRNEPVYFGPAVSVNTGEAGNSHAIFKDWGGIVQSHLLQDRVVTTFGWRHDERRSEIGAPIKLRPDGINLDYDSFNAWEGRWDSGKGPTKTMGVVVKVFPWLSVYGNKSDSFQPAVPAQDLYLNLLPDPKGEGKDYGVMLNLFSGRLVLRVNKYQTVQVKSRSGTSGTYADRLRRVDFSIFDADSAATTDTFNLQNMATRWVQSEAAARGETLTAATVETRVAGIMKLPVEFVRTPRYTNGASEDVVARGVEAELNANPTPHWTMKLNVTQQEAFNARLAPELTQWFGERMAVWKSIIDPTTGRPWYSERYNNANSAEQFVTSNITAALALARANEGLSRPQIRKYRFNYSTNFQLAAITDHKFLKRFNIGGAVRWEDRAAIGYYGVEQPPAIVTAYDIHRPVYDGAHTYVDLLAGYRTRLFNNRVGVRYQLNVRNLQEGGGLRPVAALPNGVPSAYRIIDPRLFIMSATFDF